MPLRERLLSLLLPAALLATASLARADAASCDGDAWQQVLAPGSGETDSTARAIWLDARTLRWPGRETLPEGASLRLFQSLTRVLQPSPGQPLEGAVRTHTLLPAGGGAWHLGDVPVQLLRTLHQGDLVVAEVDAGNRVTAATRLQAGAALDALFADAERTPDLGATPRNAGTTFRLWAPTARRVALCLYDAPAAGTSRLAPMRASPRTGVWHHTARGDLSGRAYTYLVEVFVRGHGWVVNRVTDPYSTTLTADSKRSVVADLASPALAPPGWAAGAALHRRVAARAPHTVDQVLYELHVRDFSASDATVPREHRGKYLAFTQAGSAGMRQLKALADAGITDIHLLPVFDLATVPEGKEPGCVEPAIPSNAAPDGTDQQAAATAAADRDCFNWGYDPYHFNAPEGSYASDAMDGRVRVRELRAMVLALHRAGLRVGMDVVYNHTTASGQKERSVLDRIVPGYYQRYDAEGKVETSTCCDNTATERRMMGKLMVDSLVLWARHYRIDSFRFDLMGHQPRALMERAQGELRRQLGREIHFIGEGWNFGEVADGARFRQASQLELEGTGIGTFSDRMRDAARGGGHDDSAEKLVARQGWLNGLHYAPNALSSAATNEDLLRAADQLRLGLAGTLRSVRFTQHDGTTRRGEQMAYGGQPAGYASQPGEVVNYVENHDNQTLWDINTLRLPLATSTADRARVQMLGAALVAFSQGVAYFHAGMEALRSKSLDRNSYDSGDWFNRIDWSFATNHANVGLPPQRDNGSSWAVMKPFLANQALQPTTTDLAWARATFADLLKIRASSTLFRLRTAADVEQRLTLLDTGPTQNPTVLAATLDGRGHPGANFQRIAYFINANAEPQTLTIPTLAGIPLELHPVHRTTTAGDTRIRDQANFDRERGQVLIPARSAVVFVQPPQR